jgi:2-(1,2-epoxy-1,2-dihydrophenyl)acetyl-CoA isomerase
MTAHKTVTLEYKNQIAVMKLNRPEARNSFNAALRKDLLDALQEVELNATVRVVILTANGKTFCAGADLKEGRTTNAEALIMREYAPIFATIQRMEKIVLVAFGGAVAGIGCALVTAADLALMAETSYLKLAFGAIALIPDGGLTWELVRALGYKRAYRLMIEAGSLNSTQCLEFGLINEVVADEQLPERALQWAERLCELSPVANRLTKRALHQAEQLSLSQTIAFEAMIQEQAINSADHSEGVEAFLRKRVPRFSGS